MKLTDYIADFLADAGIGHVFGVTGGAVVHLFDSVARRGRISPIFTHHEQAAAFAAQAYARVRNSLGAAFFTTGPGGTNALTGVCAAWLDSIPCIFISGQTRLSHTTRGKTIRQLGAQQLDIVTIVESVTKYAVMLQDPTLIRYELEKALFLATVGRPGPVWLDIPLDFQWSSVDPVRLKGFDPSEMDPLSGDKDLGEAVEQCWPLIEQAKRPLILAGYGIRLAHAELELKRLVERLAIPCVSSWNASDLIATEHPLYCGRPGLAGQRGANLAVQNCDLLIAIGSHLSIPLTGTMFNAFAREAKIVVIDVDPGELQKRAVHVDLALRADAGSFIRAMLARTESSPSRDISLWSRRCCEYKNRYNSIPHSWRERSDAVDPYVFIDVLSDELSTEDVVVIDGGGTITQIVFQAIRVKEGQRVMIDAGLCAMGSGLPSSVGAAFGGGHRTLCLCGDGSLPFNVQELQTVVHHCLPVKLFVFNNDGYLSIRHTQDGFLEGRHVGSEKEGGVSFPDVLKLAAAFGIRGVRIQLHREMATGIREALAGSDAVVCEVTVPRDQQVIPRQGFDARPDGTFAARPLEDMFPYLDRKEFSEAMVVRPWA